MKALPIYDWTGFYIGGNLGWQDAKTNGFTNSPGDQNFSLIGPGALWFLNDFSPTSQTMHGWLGGAQFGYNYQFRRAVVGFEVSGSWADLKNQTTGTAGFSTGTPFTGGLGCSQLVTMATTVGGVTGNGTVSCSAKQDWTVQALTRLGYTFGEGRFLPYVTAGGAVTHLSVATTNTVIVIGINGQDTFGASKELAGVVLGAGAQYALANGISIGAEYLYAVYPTQDFSSIGTCGPSVAAGGWCTTSLTMHGVQENHDLSTSTIRVVLNYKFSD